MMADETIVAIFDSEAHADAAVGDLTAAGVPADAIGRESSTSATMASSSATTASTTQTMTTPGGTVGTGAPREKGFWSSLFGGEPDHDTAVYDRSLESGSHVVSVRVPETNADDIITILERHNPIDIDNRMAEYGLSTAGTTTTTTRETMAAPLAVPAALATGGTVRGGDETLRLAEEQLTVGKRLVNRGTTRIRRFVVEVPVEEKVVLHSERVTIERRPVTGDVPATDADFTDKTIEMTESAEEAVVGKTVRVKEEVVIHKEAAERVETVRDTVRREDVEITKEAGVATGTAGTVEAGTATVAGAGTIPPARR